MERLLYDPKASDVAVAWRAAHFTGRGGSITELSRKKLQVILILRVNFQLKSHKFLTGPNFMFRVSIWDG